ncbi:MAG: hypothetical protein ACHP9Y_01305 [Gammaproteobacteria bacterium]
MATKPEGPSIELIAVLVLFIFSLICLNLTHGGQVKPQGEITSD